MNIDLYAALAWLPRPPSNFREECRKIGDGLLREEGNRVRQLATHGLDESDLRILAGAIARLRRNGGALSPLLPFRLGLIGNGTLEPIVPALEATAARHGINLECVQADFGQTLQEALEPQSLLNRSNVDAVLLAIDFRGLPLAGGLQRDDGALAANEALDLLDSIRNGFRINSGVPCIVQTVPPLPEVYFGNFEERAPGTLRSVTSAFNHTLRRSLADSSDILLDVAALAETVGLANWHSPTQWNLAKLSFDATYIPLYADHVCRVIAATRGKSRRCLIVDLDNTLWGGVIGDDGLEGIVIGQGDATGEAYLDVQRSLLALRHRGIVLAISSKNEEDIARAVFSKHPEMLLREDHIAVFQINWNDKASNISAIAEQLSLGLESMVFLDDNPAERALIRQTLPEVAVPELPEDPAFYTRTLLAAGYFEAIAYSEEDSARADYYQMNAQRATLQKHIGDIEAYLTSLNMRIEFRPFDAAGRVRIAQLVNKSNQFNLTTRRYAPLEIEKLEADRTCLTLQVRLSDRFGDSGIISVVICRPRSNAEWEIDTWLMSCRVLGRRVEEAVLRELIRNARASGIRRLVGIYRPTDRNRLVKEHYSKLGFTLVGEKADGETTWSLETNTEIPAPPIAIQNVDLSPAPA